MKKDLSKATLALFGLVLVFTGGLKAQNSSTALDVSRSIADKVVRETSFDYRMLPLSYNAGITGFDLEGSSPAVEGNIYYASGKLNSDTGKQGLLGFSFSGHIRVFLNGKEVFEGQSERVFLKEYTYNRYQFQRVIDVNWKAGENRILVKWLAGVRETGVPGEFLMLPLDEFDAKADGIDAQPVSDALPHTYWLTCGPWQTGGSDALDQVLPPEEGFRDYYIYHGAVMPWKYEEVPLLRELVVPESNSYTRDPYADWHYANGGTMLAILSLYRTTGNPVYLEFVQKFAANILENDAWFRWQYFSLHAVRGSFHRINRMTMLDDSGGPALPFAELQVLLDNERVLETETETETEQYKELLELNLDYVMKGQERLNDQTFSRPEPEPATVWADDLFMSVPFLLRMAKINQDPSLFDEVARQVIQFNQYLLDESTGLYFHGWYNERGENTPVRWGRANGWIIWATSEALMELPEKHPAYKKILKIYRRHMKALAAVQGESGMWHQVLDHPETFEESSCSAMFTLGMARGVRLGWLPLSYREKALKGWQALQSKIKEDGTVIDICRGTGIGEDVDFYESRKRFDHDPRGLGAMITAGCEIYLLFSPKL
jgi:unsaturated rhamnogalacturonyl hydrolase